MSDFLPSSSMRSRSLLLLYPGGFTRSGGACRCSPVPQERLVLQTGFCLGMEGSSRGGDTVNASLLLEFGRSVCSKLQHVLVRAGKK